MPPRYRQQVPRPAGARRGGPPPWADLAPAALAGIGIARVRAALAGTLPIAPGGPVGAGQAPEAAVLLALYEEAGEATALLIRRAAHLERDPGHVALPGGKVEPGEQPLAAALRESQEEVGLAPDLVEVLGALPPVLRNASDHVVLPFVAALPGRPALRPNPAEVEVVLEVSLAELAAEGVAWEEHWERPEPHPVRFFAVPLLGEDLVWGLTGRILWSLLEQVARDP